MVEKYNEINLLDLHPLSFSERIKYLKFSRLREWKIIPVSSLVKSMTCVKKPKNFKNSSGRIFSERDFFLTVENFIQYGQEKTFFHEMLERFQCIGQLGNIIDQMKTFWIEFFMVVGDYFLLQYILNCLCSLLMI